MSREIKFRAFIEATSQMLNVFDMNFIKDEDNGRFVRMINNENFDANSKFISCRVDEVELMQYTGLKDKNGVEIYEGDIVEFYIDFGYGMQKVIAKITYKDSGFKYESLAGTDFMNIFNDVKIIGNIYENPELLNNQT